MFPRASYSRVHTKLVRSLSDLLSFIGHIRNQQYTRHYLHESSNANNVRIISAKRKPYQKEANDLTWPHYVCWDSIKTGPVRSTAAEIKGENWLRALHTFISLIGNLTPLSNTSTGSAYTPTRWIGTILYSSLYSSPSSFQALPSLL